MKILYLILFSVIFYFGNVLAQEGLSVHAMHKAQFGNQTFQKSLFDESGKGIVPLKYNKSALSSAVFGYLPYWEYSSAKSNLQYDLLTHIALFDFQADTLGNMKNPSYWPWTDVINAAHNKGVKVIMCVTNFTGPQIKVLISNSAYKQNFFNNVKNIIQQYNLDGVNIDFEALNTADRGSQINGFMTDLTTFIHTNLPYREVSFAGPIINWGGWDLPGLVKACDYVFIMGYDFYGSWSPTSGPSSPLTGGTYNVTSGLTSSSFGYGGALAANSGKLILGVPYFGNIWSTKTNSAYSDTIKYLGSTKFRTEMPNSQVYGLLWDSKSQTPWFFYKQDTVYIQTWFDTDSSLGLKYDLAKKYNLMGVGMWALGQDGTRTEYWNLLRKKYLVDVKADNNIAPSGFSLSQNYPNPFNPATVIRYDIPYTCNVKLKIYDLLGREVSTIVNEMKTAGSYSVELKSNLSSGTYFYTLKAGEFSRSKKMTILK